MLSEFIGKSGACYIKSLNPCFSGICSLRQKFYYVDPFDTEGLIPDMNKQKDDNEIIYERLNESELQLLSECL